MLSLSMLSQIDACADDILFSSPTRAAHGKLELTGRACCWPGSGSFPRQAVPPSTRSGSQQLLGVTTSKGAARCSPWRGKLRPDATPGIAETVSPGERSIDPFILFVVFLVCRSVRRCRGLGDGLSDFFVVGVGQVN